MLEKKAAGAGDACCEKDAKDASDETLFPGGGGEEESRVDERVEGEDAEEEGKRAAEIEEQVRASGGAASSIL
jgi:hypothetical protein